jgi:hypothetical protein
MTTKNELTSSLNAMTRRMTELNMRRPGRDSEHYQLAWTHLGTGPGWAIVWQDTRNWGIDPIVRLGDNKRQAQETLWAIQAVLSALPTEEV